MIEYTLSELYQDDLRKSQTKMDVILRKSTKPSSVDHDLPNSQVSATHASSKVMPSSSLPDTSSSNKNSQTVSPLPNTDPQATMLSQQPKSKITLEDLIDSSLGWSVTPNKTQVEDVYAISDTEELEHEEDINALLSHAFYADSEQNKAKDKGKQPERNARSSLKRIETIEFEEPAMKKHRPDNGHQSKPPHVKPTLFQSIRMEQCQPEQSQLQHTQQQPTEQERVQPSRRLKVDSESDASESELLDTLNNKPTLARTQPNVHKSTTPHAPTTDDSDSNASESELLDTLNNKSTLSRIQRKAPNVNKPTTDDSDNNASESDLLNSTLNPSITLLLNNKPTLLPCDQEQVLVKTIHAKDSTTAQKLNALCRFRALYLLQ
ncbi:uncharacterized protein B0P05DRAFT_30639 [Gilbertella persicaria]|uniref:uncharacterized protein n=1 Tax=Gilbertella persicaria TaxID=101096 RepID=UPI00221F8C2E|nr:uncharacterized protein B0P05DRAFT_30639 [Gilbertella persicaria]KAI8084198.1 hypothetical protein B0P05DRAFT_30639 [Gilbertella persicaria]